MRRPRSPALMLLFTACAAAPSGVDAGRMERERDGGLPTDAGLSGATLTFDAVACAVPAVGDNCPTPIVGARATLTLSLAPPTFEVKQMNADGYALFTVPAELVDTTLVITAPGYLESINTVHPPRLIQQHNIFTLTASHVDPSTVPVSRLRAFKGDFGGIYIDALKPQCPEDPVTHIRCMGDNGGIPRGLIGGAFFTAAYGNYTTAQRTVIRAAYKARGYTHFPLSLSGLLCAGAWYHGLYPPLPCSHSFDNTLLHELWDDGLVPVVYVLPDGALSTDLTGLDLSLVRVVVPMWEMDGPLPGTAQINQAITWVSAQFPNALLYVHFTAEHAAGGTPEADWWRWARDTAHVTGMLYQDARWNDPMAVKATVADFLIRFGGGYHGWPTGIDFILYETDIYPKFWDGRTEQQGLDFNNQILTYMQTPACLTEASVTYCGTIGGFGSGGTP